MHIDETGGLTYINYAKGIKMSPKNYLGKWECVNLKPIYKEIEIQVMYNPETGKTVIIEAGKLYPKFGKEWIKLTGIQKVEVKPPVKKSHTIPVIDLLMCETDYNTYKISGNTEIQPDKNKKIKNVTVTIN